MLIGKHPNSRIVEIKRKISVIQELNKEFEMLGGSTAQKMISGYIQKGTRTNGSGLDRWEIDLLLPSIINLDVSDRDFRTRVENFYLEINTRIPNDGLKLETGFKKNNSEPLNEDNLPLDILDYVIYRHIKSHPQVASDEKTANSSALYSFWIVDKNERLNDQIGNIEISDKAMSLYLKNKDSKEKIKMYCELLSTNLNENNGKSDEELLVKLKQLVLDKPKQFLQVAEDKDLEIKYFIKECRSKGILKAVGTSIIDTESGDAIGATEQEAVLYLKDAANTKHKQILLNKLKSNK